MPVSVCDWKCLFVHVVHSLRVFDDVQSEYSEACIVTVLLAIYSIHSEVYFSIFVFYSILIPQWWK